MFWEENYLRNYFWDYVKKLFVVSLVVFAFLILIDSLFKNTRITTLFGFSIVIALLSWANLRKISDGRYINELLYDIKELLGGDEEIERKRKERFEGRKSNLRKEFINLYVQGFKASKSDAEKMADDAFKDITNPDEPWRLVSVQKWIEKENNKLKK